jgi:ABC-type lipoprotein export system ATPase subunit
VDSFYEYLKNNNVKFKGDGLERPYYAKFCLIVQSSGTGKSRLMTEVSVLQSLSVSGG